MRKYLSLLLLLVPFVVAQIRTPGSGGSGSGSGQPTSGNLSNWSSVATGVVSFVAGLNGASNSLVSQISAAQVWTNPAGSGLLYPSTITNQVLLGTNAPDYSLSFNTPYSFFIQAISPGNVQPITFLTTATAGDNDNGAKEGLWVQLTRSDAFTGQDSTAGYFSTSLDGNGGNQAIYNYGVPKGLKGQTSGGYVRRNSQGVGVLGVGALSTTNINYGVIGLGANSLNGSTNVGVAGTGISYGGTGIHVGVYGEITSSDSIDVHLEQAAGLFDSRDLSDPILLCRTNNGTFKAFQVNGDKTTNATPFDAGGRITAYGGLYAPTNYAPYSPILTNAFVLGTRYTNTVAGGFSGGRATIQASFTLNGAAAGTAKVSVYAEQGALTNRLSISAGPLASLTIIDVLMMRVNPGGIFYFTDETSGAGASVAIVAATSSYFGE